MAAYAATVTLDTPKALRMGSTRYGVLFGQVDVTNYNTSLEEVAGITGKFRSAPRVMLGGLSSNGYVVKWDRTSKSVKAYRVPTITASSSAPTITTGTDAGVTEPMYTNGGALTQTTGAAGITGVQAPTITVSGSGAALSQAANDTNIGSVDFCAVGLI